MNNLTYYLEQPPAPANAIPVRDGIYWLRLPLPFELNHINVWLIEDDDGWVLVDTGMNVPVTRAAWMTLYASELLSRPVSRIIVTHHHPDHMGLAKWLSDMNQAPVCLSAPALNRARQLLADTDTEKQQEQLEFYQNNGVEHPALLSGFVNGRWYKKLVSGIPGQVHIIEAGVNIRIGGHNWQTITSHGHAEGHVSLYSESAQAVISGDQVLPTITSNISLFLEDPDLDPLADFLDSMLAFRDLPPTVLVLPSHGLVFTGLHERLDAIEHSHRQRSRRIEGLLKDSSTVSDMVRRVFPRALDDVNWCLAFGEVHAHLRYLLKQGLIQKQVKNELIQYYV